MEDNFELNLPNEDLADHLYEIFKYYELENDTYRAKTFLEVSEKIRIYPDLIISGKDAKDKIGRGIGNSSIEVIDEFISTRYSTRLNNLKNKHVDREKIINIFLTLHGVGTVTANKFYDAGYRTFEDLWFKANLTNAQKLSIYYRNHLQQRITRKEMDAINQSFKNVFHSSFELSMATKSPNVTFEIVGSYRRGEISSGDIDVLLKSSPNISLITIVDTLKKLDTISGDLAQGDSKYLGLFHLPGLNTHRLDLLVIDPDSWSSALMYFTGSQRFNILIRQRAKDLGLRLNEHGLFKPVDILNKKEYSVNSIDWIRISTETEEDIFKYLKIKYLDPSQRTRDLLTLEVENK